MGEYINIEERISKIDQQINSKFLKIQFLEGEKKE